MAGKLITVFGATGAQGNSVALALLDNSYKVRALTRNPDGKAAQSLLSKGCEVVKVDMDDKANLEKAIAGSYGVFAVTNYWGLLAENPATAFDREVAQGKNIGDVCKEAGVKHLVYSGLENVKELIGKPCPHFDGKGIVEKYLDEINVPNTSTRVAYYYENFTKFFPPKKNEDGTYSITLPMKGPMDAVCVSDLGHTVATIFNSPDQFSGKKIGISGDRLTMAEYTAIMSEVTGKTVTYNQVSVETFAGFGFPGADDTAAMFEFYDVGKVDRDAKFTRTLNPNTLDFKQWAEKNKENFIQ